MTNNFRVWNKITKSYEVRFVADIMGFLYKNENNQLHSVDQDNYIILFSTGLRDIQGMLIFEGDICVDDKGVIVEILRHKYQWSCKVLKGGALTKGSIFPLWQWDDCDKNANRKLKIKGTVMEHKI